MSRELGWIWESRALVNHLYILMQGVDAFIPPKPIPDVSQGPSLQPHMACRNVPPQRAQCVSKEALLPPNRTINGDVGRTWGKIGWRKKPNGGLWIGDQTASASTIFGFPGPPLELATRLWWLFSPAFSATYFAFLRPAEEAFCSFTSPFGRARFVPIGFSLSWGGWLIRGPPTRPFSASAEDGRGHVPPRGAGDWGGLHQGLHLPGALALGQRADRADRADLSLGALRDRRRHGANVAL